jgi:hypothetical protein
VGRAGESVGWGGHSLVGGAGSEECNILYNYKGYQFDPHPRQVACLKKKKRGRAPGLLLEGLDAFECVCP